MREGLGHYEEELPVAPGLGEFTIASFKKKKNNNFITLCKSP